MTDIRTSGTAFVVGAEGITLDLNGHEVVYGDRPPMVIANGGFEEGKGTKVPGWDLSAANSAAIAPNTHYLSGKQVLRLANLTQPQRIVSDAITVPGSNHTFAAAITPGHSNGGASLKLTVIDARSGRMLGRGESRSVERGFSAVAHFTLTTAGSIRLVIDVAPTGAQPDTVDLDDAVVFPSFDYGVLATRTWSGEIDGWSNLPERATSTYRTAGRFTIRGGNLTKGGGDGYGCSPLYFADISGLIVDQVATYTRGMDVSSLIADRAGGPVTIRDSTFKEEVGLISDRMKDYSTLALTHINGPLLVEGNTLDGCPQIGMHLGFNDGKAAVKVLRNTIRQRAVATNAYGIVVVSLQNFEIAANRIVAENGRGLDIDGYSAQPLRNGLIRDNFVDVRERLNREYPTRLESRALRLRNNVDAMGVHHDLRIVGNTFIATTGPGLCQKAFGARISYVNKDRTMNDAGIVIARNTFRSVVLTDDPEYHAYAFVVDTLGAGIHPTIIENIFESNDTSLAIGESEAGDNEDFALAGNVLRKSRDGAKRPFTGVRVGYYTERTTGVKLLGSRLENDATLNFEWRGTGPKEVSVGSILAVRVLDAKSRPVPRAAVRASTSKHDGDAVATTDAQGKSSLPLIEMIYSQKDQDPKSVNSQRIGAYTVTATSGMSSAQATVAEIPSTPLEFRLR